MPASTPASPSAPLIPLSEITLQHLARILGPSSAAQLALDNAAARRAQGQSVAFVRSGASIVVVQLDSSDKTPQGETPAAGDKAG